MGARQVSRTSVAVSVTPLAWGIVLLVVGTLGSSLSSMAAFRGSNAIWGLVLIAMILATLVGLVLVVVGVVYLAGNVDYLAAREAQRHRDEVAGARSASPERES